MAGLRNAANSMSRNMFLFYRRMLAVVGELKRALNESTLVADGAMGTMLQAQNIPERDFMGNLGCNEVLNITRPEAVIGVHRGFLQAGCDCIETNSFGANLTALAEYGIANRIGEFAQASARLARMAADEFTDKPRYVLGSIGPGTKLATLEQIEFAALRDAYQLQAEALITGGVDGFQIETCQDILQAKAAVIACKRANHALGCQLPILVSVTLETSGSMLVGSDITAVLVAVAAQKVDCIGLNCGTGPAQMRQILRYLSRYTTVVSAMPNAGLPEMTSTGVHYPMQPRQFGAEVAEFVSNYGLSLVGGCCGTTPEHLAELVRRVRECERKPVSVQPIQAVSSTYSAVELRQADDASGYLIIGERTNANGSKKFREALLADDWDQGVEIAKSQQASGAQVIDVSLDYVGRDPPADMSSFAARLATGVPLPVMLDSINPAVIQAGLERLAGRCIVNSVNYEDGGKRLSEIMPLVVEHGAAVVVLTIDEAGMARTEAGKVQVASRAIAELQTSWKLGLADILVDCLTFPISSGQAETRRDGLETIAAIAALNQKFPGVNTTLGISNISFGLNPAARKVLNSLFLNECLKAGLSSAIVNPALILPLTAIPDEQRRVGLDLIYDRATTEYDPLESFIALFDTAAKPDQAQPSATTTAALSISEKLRGHIIAGTKPGLESALEEALVTMSPLEIINDELLVAMKTVGELFSTGEMQLPFVLSAAEVMKQAVDYLQAYLPNAGEVNRGVIVLATVAGDVHDIGKNLVDIILSNNGFRVVNLGVKQSIAAIAHAAVSENADAIGMSGLLVKSTVVMRDNLAELEALKLTDIPVLLGGAALNRSYVTDVLNAEFSGEVRYARDAFEGLKLMEDIVSGQLRAAPPKVEHREHISSTQETEQRSLFISDEEPVPVPPFWGSQVETNIDVDELAHWLDRRALFTHSWGLSDTTAATSRLEYWLERFKAEQWVTPAVVYGYWPCQSEGNDLILGDPKAPTQEIARLHFPRQVGGQLLCIADYFRNADAVAKNGHDVIALQLVTLGTKVAQQVAERFTSNQYRDYLEAHGLGVRLTEALAECWHAKIRKELGFNEDASTVEMLHHHRYQGARYGFGYPSCPDLEKRAVLVELLNPARIQVKLSEHFQLHPEMSTDAIIVHHRQAKHFSV
ncbi:MAG: methionine synthase [Propionibacteriaceae bacterium]|nr:methionine synthase [Propionibacteriaceae bacterium]